LRSWFFSSKRKTAPFAVGAVELAGLLYCLDMPVFRPQYAIISVGIIIGRGSADCCCSGLAVDMFDIQLAHGFAPD
jgi:hypothetical protein